MNNLIHILKIALLTSAIFLLHARALAQDNLLELLPGSDQLEYNEKTGLHRLFGVGGVNFKYQGKVMYCDSALYRSKTKELRAYGNVHLTKDDLNLFCDSLYYNGATEKAKLWGKVRVRDSEYKLSTDTLEYDSKQSVAIYRYGGKISSILNNETLTSRVGYLYSESKNMFFSNKVVYKTPELIMKTDTLRYDYARNTTHFFGPTNIVSSPKNEDTTFIYCERGRFNTKTEEATLQINAQIKKKGQLMNGDHLYSHSQKGISTGKGNVVIKDTTQKVEFWGDYAWSSDSAQSSYLTGNALFLKIEERDTLFIHADTLYSFKDSLGEASRMLAYHRVRMFREDMQARCDSLMYDKSIGKMELYKEPIVWVKKTTELKGDFIEVYISSDSILEKALVVGNSTVLMEVDSGKYYNQIGGKDITAFFRNNEVYRTDVVGNARTISFPEDTENTDTTVVIKRIGMNRIYASDLKVYIDSNEISGITYLEKPDGIFYPMDQLNKEEQYIQGFKWMQALRPKTWHEILIDIP